MAPPAAVPPPAVCVATSDVTHVQFTSDLWREMEWQGFYVGLILENFRASEE